MSGRCERCNSRAVVEASRLCLLCGHVGRPGQDRASDISYGPSTTLVPHRLCDADDDEEAS